jgi:Quinohemoprotein amine dehydrogenase A, alpha subunit, haem binding
MSPTRKATPASRIPLPDERKDHSLRTIVILIAAALVITAVLVACGSDPTQPPPQATSADAPAIDAAALLQTRCTICHTLDRVEQARKTSAEWDQTVTRMIGKGAQLSDAEKQALVAYLAKTYGP